MKLSVIIPCFNGVCTLGAQLEALARQEWIHPWEVVLANNGSTDGSVDLAKSFCDRIDLRVVDASERRGQPFATNTGAHAARGESLAFTDADDVIADGWVAAMGNALEQHEFVACRTDGEKLNPPGLRLSPQREGLQKAWYPPWLPHAGGGTMGIRKSLFESLGDFDESLPYLNDTDYCIRAGLRGVNIHYVPEAVLYLRNRTTFRAHLRQSMKWAEWAVVLAQKYWQPTDDKRPFWRIYASDWIRVIRLAPQAFHPAGRFPFAWWLGRQLGRTKGILKNRGGVPV